jgi:hypothetical protein
MSRSGTHSGVHADADACIGNHDIGNALRSNAGLAGGHDAVYVGDVGAINLKPADADGIRLGPGLDFRRAARGQRQPVAC